MKVMKRSCCTLLFGLFAVMISPSATASNAPTKPSFVPHSHAVIPKSEDVSRQKLDARLYRQVSARGGADSADSFDAIRAVLGFFAIDYATRKVFEENNISFPSQLGGCLILFVAMVFFQMIIPGLGDKVFSFLNPGAVLLAKWLPVFFVPGLAMLPLAPSVGSPLEVFKVVGVVVLGFLFTITSTAFAVLAVRTAAGAVPAAVESSKGKKSVKEIKKKVAGAPSAPLKPYSDETIDFLIKGSVLSGAISVAATRANFDLATPLQTIYMLFVTFATYVYGARLPSGFTKIVHPLVTSTGLTLFVMKVTSLLTDTGFLDVLRTYKVGSTDPLRAGAGDILLYLLGPSVVSFAMSMYGRKNLLKENLLAVVVAMLVSSVGGLFGTGALARLIQLGGAGDNFLRRSVLTRNVTTALAIAVTAILEGDIAICSSVVVLTGIIGATYGKALLTAMGVKDPVTRGLAVGASSQGLGVASIADETDAFPFAAISMVLTAVSATVLVSIPAVKEALLAVLTSDAVVAAAEGVAV